MEEGDREMMSCDAFCAVAASQSKMLRQRARPLRESAEGKYLSKLEAELQELEIKKFQLDADNAEITDWITQLCNCTNKLFTMSHLHRDGESQPPPPPTMLPCPVLHSSMQASPTLERIKPSCNTLWIVSQFFIKTCAFNTFG